MAECWLCDLMSPGKTLPSYPVRTPLIELLGDVEVEVDHLKNSKIGKVIRLLYKHADETEDNKAKLRRIMDTWSRLIMSNSSARHKPVEVSQPAQLCYRSPPVLILSIGCLCVSRTSPAGNVGAWEGMRMTCTSTRGPREAW
jgi:hypothetical protein